MSDERTCPYCGACHDTARARAGLKKGLPVMVCVDCGGVSFVDDNGDRAFPTPSEWMRLLRDGDSAVAVIRAVRIVDRYNRVRNEESN